MPNFTNAFWIVAVFGKICAITFRATIVTRFSAGKVVLVIHLRFPADLSLPDCFSVSEVEDADVQWGDRFATVDSIWSGRKDIFATDLHMENRGTAQDDLTAIIPNKTFARNCKFFP